MTRHLQSISTETEQATTTLRQLTGDRQSNDEVDYYLRKKLGATVYYISAVHLYGINEFNRCPADPIVNGRGGVLAYYDSIKEVSIERRNNVSRHLGAASLELRTLACFTPIDEDEAENLRVWQYDTSLGFMMESVGIELDEEVGLKTVEEVLSTYAPGSVDDDGPIMYVAKQPRSMLG